MKKIATPSCFYIIIVKLRYYEIIKVIEINEIIADTILICQVFWRMKN